MTSQLFFFFQKGISFIKFSQVLNYNFIKKLAWSDQAKKSFTPQSSTRYIHHKIMDSNLAYKEHSCHHRYWYFDKGMSYMVATSGIFPHLTSSKSDAKIFISSKIGPSSLRFNVWLPWPLLHKLKCVHEKHPLVLLLAFHVHPLHVFPIVFASSLHCIRI